MTVNAKIGAALVGGYLLGRTKKAKLAIGFGMFLAGKKLSLDPKQLGRMLADSPLLGGVSDQVRKELVGATKTAATNALTQRATGLADSLHQRTLELEDPSQAKDDRAGDDADEAEDDDAPDAQDDERDGDKDDGDDKDDEGTEEKPAPRRTAAKKTAAKKTAKSAGGARKKAAPATRKATSGARRTASSNARRDRGGSNG
ncbi:hypothetical protein B046DRAFT_01458 [Streptomyces sp. LamerLS-316]|uniref:hypothetical protein n=1 Tax=unclassified Streptomyces TaxID=2593676 RepID=UPI000823CAE0|nr:MULTISPECIES: hypothetical protein [unclassified Streptomyces]MYQ40422.1 hypothetical protein [Streptomyces sp. SID4921]SCK15308.1 hypothetical protein B046DRAFT_01458 [Streptomyces sp. LamerLS-316]